MAHLGKLEPTANTLEGLKKLFQSIQQDKVVVLVTDHMEVQVNVLDIRKVFNRFDTLVTPIAGSGETWVAVDRLRW